MNFEPVVLAFLILCFLWSGFVRTGFGFGANALLLPLALLAVSDPLVIIPVVAIQGSLLNGFESIRNFRRISWRTLGWLLLIYIPTFTAGLYGLLSLPNWVLNLMIYGVTVGYALIYMFEWKFHFRSRLFDLLVVMLGGYVTGFSMSGGPLTIAIALKYISRELLRTTLMVLWALVGISKLTAFILVGVDIQLGLFFWTMPAVVIGHFIGLRFHDRILHTHYFYRILGGALLAISLLGIVKTLL